jgi:signal transduction histidine kinase
MRPAAASFTRQSCELCPFLATLELGLIILDPAEEMVLFSNLPAAKILDVPIIDLSYELVAQSFEPGLQEARRGTGGTTNRTITLDRCGRVVGYSIYPMEPNHFGIVLRDITDRKRLESIAEAVNAMESIGFVFSGIRHELGNPVNSVKLALAVLRKQYDRFSREEVLSYLERAQGELQRIEYLLHSLRSFSLFERPSLEKVSVTSFVERLLALVQADLERRRVRLEYVPTSPHLTVRADPRALHQVMLNLVSNAADALEGTVEGAITIYASSHGGQVVLAVEDNGRGMSSAQLGNLFKPFVTTKAKGTGLGMVIARRMVTDMKGAIRVESAPGQGTTVYVSLPEEILDDA